MPHALRSQHCTVAVFTLSAIIHAKVATLRKEAVRAAANMGAHNPLARQTRDIADGGRGAYAHVTFHVFLPTITDCFLQSMS